MEPLKLIIAGGREFNPTPEFIQSAILMFGILPTKTGELEIVSGGARGVDWAGEAFAMRYGYPIKRFPAHWSIHGKAAGPLRNKQMAEYGDALFLMWDDMSAGSADIKSQMLVRKKPIHEIVLRTYPGEERLFA